MKGKRISFVYDWLQRITSGTYADINDAGRVSATNRYNTSYIQADLRGNFSNNQQNRVYLGGSRIIKKKNISEWRESLK